MRLGRQSGFRHPVTRWRPSQTLPISGSFLNTQDRASTPCSMGLASPQLDNAGIGRGWATALSFMVLGLVAFPPTQTAAQVPQPQLDAGSLGKRNILNSKELEQQVKPADGLGLPAAPARPETAKTRGGPVFVLRDITFGPSRFLCAATLADLARPYLNSPVAVSDIQKLIDDVNLAYARLGQTSSSAVLPPQSIKQGLLRIDLIEGKIGELKFEDGVVQPDRLKRQLALNAGEVLDVAELAGRMAMLNRTGDVQFRTALQPGTQFGLTDVTVSATQPARNSLQFFGDNFGVSTVGRAEGGALYQRAGLLGADDRLKLYAVKSRGNISNNVSYTFGIGDFGTRLGLAYAQSGIRIINGPSSGLEITGTSRTSTVNLVQPVYGDVNWLALVNAGGALSNSTTKQANSPITENNTTKGSVGFTLSYYGDSFNVSVSSNLAAARSELVIVNQKLDYSVASGSFSGAFKLPAGFSVQTSGSWSAASVMLVPGDQLFQLGGSSSLRGYPSNTVAGGRGYSGSFELHRAMDELTPGIDVFAFLDHGRVYSTFPKQTLLTSVGVGLSYAANERVTTELSIGFPLKTIMSGQPAYEAYARLILKAF